MEWSKRGPGSPSRRRRAAFRPLNETLEERRLLTTFDLSTTQTAPLGVEFVGKAANNTAGYTVTDVGDITGSGFDSFVISAVGLPGQSVASSLLNRPDFAAAGESAAYVVFGSKQVNISNAVDFLNLTNGTLSATGSLTGGQRAGDLGELGTTGVAGQTDITNPTAQTNPTVFQPQPVLASTHIYGFNYDGLTLVTGLDSATGLGRNSALGFSVSPLGDINNDGFDDFAISAPNDAGGGKVFIIYGGTALTTQAIANKTIDLEPNAGTNATTTPTKVVTLSLPNSAAGTDVGYSVAGIGNFFNTTSGRDIAVGVPGLTVGGNAGAGAVFAVSGAYINSLATGTPVDLSTISDGSNNTAGIEYTGTAAGALTGSPVATAGNFDGQTGSGRPLDDLLIGAPGINFGAGRAYLVYSNQSFLQNSTRGTTQSLASLGQTPTTNPVTNPLQGLVLSDQSFGDNLGFAVASAGDFSSSGVDGILLGAPGYLTNTGYAYVVYGLSGTTTTRLNGLFNLNPTAATTGLPGTSFIGRAMNDYTGYSLATTTHIVISGATATTPAPTFDILIGAPGAAGGGEAYLVPGTGTGATLLTVPQMLTNINTTLNGSLFNVSGTSDPAVVNGSGKGFGISVSARNPIFDADTLNTTVDGDAVPDLFFGSPFSSLSNPDNEAPAQRSFAGLTYVVQGGFIGSSSGGGGGGGGGTTGATAAVFPNAFGLLTPQVFTGDNNGLPYPAVSSLSVLTSYQPLPVQIAYQQFLASPGFLAREEFYHHPSKAGNSHSTPAGTVLNVPAIRHSENKYAKVNTLDVQVRTRGKFKVGKKTTYTHKVKVIPKSQQTETFPG